MNAVAHPSGTGLLSVIRETCATWTRRHWFAAILIASLPLVVGNRGGILWEALEQGNAGEMQPWRHLVLWFTTIGMPLVLAIRVADRYVDEGAKRSIAYGLAVLAVAVGGTALAWLWIPRLMPLWGWWAQPGAIVHVALSNGAVMAVAVAVYSSWRQERRSLERVHSLEQDRAREIRRILASRLLALQARVEPQVLFDALTRITTYLPEEVDNADALLAELIAMLRMMVPALSSGTSTVAREVGLAHALARVAGAPKLRSGGPSPDTDPEVAEAELAPTILLALLRCLSSGRVAPLAIEARRDVEWLRIAVTAPGDARDPGWMTQDLAQVREIIADAYGHQARLQVEPAPNPRVILEVPYRHAHSADR